MLQYVENLHLSFDIVCDLLVHYVDDTCGNTCIICGIHYMFLLSLCQGPRNICGNLCALVQSTFPVLLIWCRS